MEQNILIKVTGEADLTQSQLQMRELNNRGKELEEQMRNLAKAEKEDIAAAKKRIAEGKEEASVIQEILQYRKEQKTAIQQEIAANEKAISSLKKNISTMNAMQGAGGKLMTQIRAIREQLAQMELAGDTSSQAFIDLSVTAAKLSDQMGDTQRQIAILASDTKNLDAALSVGTGVAGAFNAATSAAALLGGESEALQQAFLKVQAALAVLNGVQQVATAFNKDSAAQVVLRTALTKLFVKEKQKQTVATAAATTATEAETTAEIAGAAAQTAQTGATKLATSAWAKFTAVLLANPLAWVAALVAAAAAGIYYLAKSFDDSADRAERMNNVLATSSKRLQTLKEDAEFESKILQLQGKSEEELLEKRIAAARERVKLADEAYDTMQREYVNARRHNDDMQQAMDDAIKNQQDAWADLNALNQERTLLIYKQEAEQRKAADEYAKQRRADIAEAEKQLADTRIALMADGAEKEIARINLDYDRKIATIKGQSAAETELRTQLETQRQEAIAKVREKLAADEREQMRALEQMRLENDAKMAESLGGEYLYETRKEVLEKQAELEIAAINESEKNEEMKAEKIIAVNARLKSDLQALEKQRSESVVADVRMEAEMRVKEAENAAIAILNSETSTAEQVKAARETLASHDRNLRDIRMQELQAQYERGLVDEQEFQDKRLDIEREALEAEAEMIAARSAQTQELLNGVLSFVSDMANEVFGAISDHIQQQLDDLNEYYTTDAEEAKEDAKKKYLSEKEMEDKKLELKRKAAAVEKAEAAFNIAMNTAMAIMRIWADVPKVDFGATTIALTALASALGATQLAMVLAKPLPKYAKGRKGGKGEFAMVGERGAEMMYIPEGASIVPHNKIGSPETWGDYGVPSPVIPPHPSVEEALTQFAVMQQLLSVDYDRLGKAVADNIKIPTPKTVNVSVSRSGVTVTDGGDTHTYLNRKYQGTWN